MKWVFLWKARVTEKSFTFCDGSDLPNAGFQSLYAIPEAEAEKLLEVGTYKNYQGPVNSTNELWMDFDDAQSAQIAINKLETLKLAFSVWTTGNRGKHICVYRKAAIISEHVPAIDRAWVQGTFNGADTSIYSSIHPFRRPGAIHEVSLKPKKLEYSRPGNQLELSEEIVSTKRNKVVINNRSVFEDPYILSLSVPYYDGERHNYFLKLAIRLAGCGVSENFIFEWLWNVNLLGDPWDEEKIRKISKWAFNAAHSDTPIHRSWDE